MPRGGARRPDRIRGFGSAYEKDLCVMAMGRTRPGGTGSSGQPVRTLSGRLCDDITGRELCRQRVWALRYAGQCLAVDGGLLSRQLSRRTGGWLGVDNRRLQSPRRSRRFLDRRSEDPPRRHPRLAHHQGPQRRPGFPCWEDAYPLNIYLFTPGVPGRGRWNFLRF